MTLLDLRENQQNVTELAFLLPSFCVVVSFFVQCSHSGNLLKRKKYISVSLNPL